MVEVSCPHLSYDNAYFAIREVAFFICIFETSVYASSCIDDLVAIDDKLITLWLQEATFLEGRDFCRTFDLLRLVPLEEEVG